MILETERLILRNFKDNDLEFIYKYRNNSSCSKYQRWKDTSKEYLKNFIEIEKNKAIPSNTIQLAISLKNTDRLVGDIFIAFKGNVITLGYTIDPNYQRQGHAYEILKSFICYLDNEFPKYEIVSMVHPNNEASENLLKKLNFKSKGYIEQVDSILYSIK